MARARSASIFCWPRTREDFFRECLCELVEAFPVPDLLEDFLTAVLEECRLCDDAALAVFFVALVWDCALVLEES